MGRAGEALAHLRLASGIAGLDVSEFVVPTDRHLVVDGLRLHCLDWSQPASPAGHDRPSLLFLHGGRLTAHTWDLVCLTLRSCFRCVAMDQRGHATLPDGRYTEVRSAGHNIQGENPRGLTQVLSDFFTEIEGSPTR